jgi:UDP-N-acetylglucosamine--N-acetylmuramyl-(pentapeptide) pyrophosphoryl-undecaprenol N-acetylglucosamine transferase
MYLIFQKIFLKNDKADFAVSRAGASTLMGIMCKQFPTFFIPFKYAAADHQYYNAKALFDKNLCFLQREEELDEEYFFEAINSDIHKISIELISSINSNAISLIVDIILKDNK